MRRIILPDRVFGTPAGHKQLLHAAHTCPYPTQGMHYNKLDFPIFQLDQNPLAYY